MTVKVSDLRAALERCPNDEYIVLVETPRSEPVGPGRVAVTEIVVQLGGALVLKVEES